MRVTFATSYDKTIQNINSKKEALDQLSTMLVTGQRLLSPHDDPYAWSQSIDLRQSLRELDSIETNLDFAVSWSEVTDAALGDLFDLLIQAKDLAIASVGESSTAEQQARSDEMEQVLLQAKQIANTQYNDDYVFSGWYAADGSFGASQEPFDSSFVYQGNDGSLEVRTSTSSRDSINLDGERVFVISDPTNPGSTVNILEALSDLQAAISSGNEQSIQDSMTIMEAAQEHVNSLQALVGARLSRLENQQNTLQSITLGEQERLSEISEADYVEVATQLQQKQIAFQAALQVTSMLDELSLLDFL